MTTFTAPTLGDSPHNSKSVYEMLEDVDHGDDLWGEPALRAMDIAGVKAGWHCADIGAGSGAITELLARRVTKSGRIYAVDQDPTSRDAIADIAIGHTQVIALTQAVEDLTLPEAVDLVWCRFLLLHVWDPEVAIAAMVASLKPGGWLIFEHSPMIASQCTELLASTATPSGASTPSGPWSVLRTIKDLAGLPRVTVARRP
jgi:ubiquinone/menaquinone biosynthesis C-methylase UbiE